MKDDARPLAGAARTARRDLRKPTSKTTLASLVVVDLSKAIVLDASSLRIVHIAKRICGAASNV